MKPAAPVINTRLRSILDSGVKVAGDAGTAGGFPQVSNVLQSTAGSEALKGQLDPPVWRN